MSRIRPLFATWLLAASAALVPAAAAPAQFGLAGGDAPKSAEDLVQVRVLADVDHITAGSTFHVVVVFDIAPQWHIYWRNPGVSGVPTEVRVTAPEGYEVGRPRFTRPSEIDGPDGLTYGYEKQAALFVPVTAPADLAPGPVPVRARINYLVCKKSCMLGDVNREITLTATGGPADRATMSAAVRPFRDRLPQQISKVTDATSSFDGAELRLAGPAGEAEQLTFFPAPMPGVRFGEVSSSIRDGRFEVRVPVQVRPADALGAPIALEGLVALGMNPDDPSYEFEMPLAPSPR